MPTQRRISHLLRRVAQASREEVVFRGQQAVWNRSEVLRSRIGLGSRADGKSFADRDSGAAGRFFFSTPELPALARTLRERLPRAAEGTIERAERICTHRFDLLSYRDLDLGQRLNWHWDPIHRKQAPREIFYKIPYLDFDVVGDSKIIWELNRHQHFITLGRAYQLTNKAEYFQEFVREYYDWHEQNPYLVGINWASSLEIAFRSLSWLWAGVLFSNSRAFSARFKQDLLMALGRNARFIEHNLSTYFSPNTHLLGEALALFFIGTLCPQLRRAQIWQSLGWQILLQEAERQVRSDGGYFEQATYYHTYALDMLLHARILASRNRVLIPESFDHKIQRMLEYLAVLGTASAVPRFGDDDGGRLFDPQRNQVNHLTDPLSTGAALYRRAEWKACAPGLIEETLWLLGAEGATEFDALPVHRPQTTSRAFPESGTYVLASGGISLVVDAGPFGTGHCGHAHSDALSVTAAADGREYLRDPGTGSYTGSEAWRESFRSTAAHNTVRIDGFNQAEVVNPFKWENIPQVSVDRWHTSEHYDLLIASHNGYKRLPSPVTHRRLLFFVKPAFWLVVDTIEGIGIHQIEAFWHVPDTAATLTATGLEVGSQREDKFAILTLSDPAWSRELIESWHSPCYGQRLKAAALRCSIRTTLPADYAWLLMPHAKEVSGRLVRLSATNSTGNPRGYRYTCGGESHSWLLADGLSKWQLREFESDASFLYCQQNAQGMPLRVFMSEGSLLSINGLKVLNNPSRIELWERNWTKDAEETTPDRGGYEAPVLLTGAQKQTVES